MEVAFRILKYIKGTVKHGLSYTPAKNFKLFAYVNVGWAGCLDDIHGTYGYAILLGDNLFSWSSKKQSYVTLSTAEAEYIAISHASQQIVWTDKLIYDHNTQVR